MIGRWVAASAPWLARLEPERAHRLAISALRAAAPFAGGPPAARPNLRTTVFGLDFPHPLGLAAGFDKSAEAPKTLAALGFAFVEVGTLTPKPQAGNPKPRLFRLEADAAVINRFGFNNDGYEAAHARLKAGRGRGVLGVNVGPNKDAEDRNADFAAGVRRFCDVADYITINVSSPNTPGLRDLQRREGLDGVVKASLEARATSARRPPLLIKIAPDLTLQDLDDVVSVARDRGLDGMIISNTTIARPASLRDAQARETGGLSGRPLFALSTRILAETFARVERAFPLIGCGGIEDAQTALAKIEAGASLLQLYSGFVLKGPALIAAVLDGLEAALEGERIEKRVGIRAAEFREI